LHLLAKLAKEEEIELPSLKGSVRYLYRLAFRKLIERVLSVATRTISEEKFLTQVTNLLWKVGLCTVNRRMLRPWLI